MLSALGKSVAVMVVAAAVISPAAAALELPAPPQPTPLLPWLVLAFVILALSFAVYQIFYATPREAEQVSSHDAWSRTESELAPRPQTATRLPSRDVKGDGAAGGAAAGDRAAKPQPVFGRRSS